ncbi:MAG: hypothetical protein J0L51_09560 [Rhizobiales bacterium]|nr:hypothetical protein [Hyphomicrobiales bacterium]
MPTDLPSPKTTILYSHRPKPFAAELELELTAFELIATRGRSVQRFPLTAIEKVTLVFSPRNTAHHAFACTVRATDGKSVKFDSLSWKSLIETEKQNGDYTRFVSTLCERVEAASPKAVLHAGVVPFKHTGMLVMGIAMIVGLAASSIYAFRTQSAVIGGVALFMLAYLAWWMRDYLTRNRPRAFKASAIPPSVLPATSP